MRTGHTSGFTLIELISTVAIAAILLTLGVPSFKDTILSNRMAGHSNRFLSALNITRSEAIKRGQSVTLCKANVDASPPSCNTGTCDTASGDNCWGKGWLVFVDANSNGLTDQGETIIRSFEGLPETLTLHTNSANVAYWIAFDSTGAGKGNNGLVVASTFNLCQGNDEANGRSIILNALGRAKIQKRASSCP